MDLRLGLVRTLPAFLSKGEVGLREDMRTTAEMSLRRPRERVGLRGMKVRKPR